MESLLLAPPPEAPHIDEDELVLFVSGRMDSDRFLLIEGHLEICSVCRRLLQDVATFKRSFAGLANPPDDRRRDRRLSTNDTASLRLIHPMLGQRTPARIVDVSRHGMKVHLLSLLPENGIVQVRLQESIILAEVRYSRLVDDGGFYAGLRILDLNRMTESLGVANSHCPMECELETYVKGNCFGDSLALMNTHLEQCLACRKAISTVARWCMRREVACSLTFNPSDSGMMRVLEPFGPRLLEVAVLDSGTNELRLRVPAPVSQGATIQLFISGAVVLGYVRRSIPARGANCIEVQVLGCLPHLK